ncbi:MAG: hypothetical protein ACPG4T_03855 [Nannocystaceae bacterium]
MSKTPWQNPILIAPEFVLARPRDSVVVPLSDVSSAVDALRFPSNLAFGLMPAYVDEHHDRWMISAGPGDGLCALAPQLQILAPHLPDLHLICHDEEPTRMVLTHRRITEVTIREGVARLVNQDICQALARARYLDTSQGAQGFATELELLLSLGPRGLASPAIVEHCATEVASLCRITTNQATGTAQDLWNTDTLFHQLAALQAMGVSTQVQTTALEQIERAASSALFAQLRATGTRVHNPLAGSQLAPILGPNSHLARVLQEVGAGRFYQGIELWPSCEVIRQRNMPKSTLLPIGSVQGRPLLLDTRFHPAPVVQQISQTTFLELEASLFGLLAWQR